MAFDAIVLGIGGMGASACMHMAQRGMRVLGLEQFALGHALGSSHGGSRIIRDCYFEHEHYVPLLLRCNVLWTELQARVGEQFVHRPGVLYMAHPGGVAVERSAASGARFGVECERMSAPQVRERFPQFTIPNDWNALFEPNGGFVRPERAIAAHAAVAVQCGAELHEYEPALEWKADAHGVTVRTAQATYAAQKLVVCAGAWTQSMLGGMSLPPLRPLRVPLAWLSPRTPDDLPACTAPRMPVWYAEGGDVAPVYGVPLAPGQGSPDGIKVALHGGPTARECEAATVDRTCTPAEQEYIRRAAERFVPCAAGAPTAGAVCLYTMSPDEHFVIDHLPDHTNVVIACGFSGHGFKFTPVVGEVLADLVSAGRTNRPVEFLSLARFGLKNAGFA